MKSFSATLVLLSIFSLSTCHASPGWGSLSIRVQFPAPDFALHIIPPASETVGIAVFNPGNPQPITVKTLNRNQNRILITALTEGEKKVLSVAVDSNGQILSGAVQSVSILSGQTQQLELELQENFQAKLDPSQQLLLDQVQTQLNITPLSTSSPSVLPSPSVSAEPNTSEPVSSPSPMQSPGPASSQEPSPSPLPSHLSNGVTRRHRPSPSPSSSINVGGGSASIGVEVTIITGPSPPITVN